MSIKKCDQFSDAPDQRLQILLPLLRLDAEHPKIPLDDSSIPLVVSSQSYHHKRNATNFLTFSPKSTREIILFREEGAPA